MGIRTLAQLPFAGKRVILRCDLNVPIKNGEISDDGRIRSSLSTINILLESNCSIVIIAHLGRPKGEVKQELPPLPIDVLNVPKDSQALTRAGRSYSKAAIELHNLQKRRGEVLKEYEERMKTVAPTIQELVVLHDRINQIVMELAQG